MKPFKMWSVFVILALLISLLPGQVQPVAAVSPDIVLSQVFGGGGNSGALYKNDFIELFNRGAAAVNLSGWSVQYASATGTSWATTELSGSIAPGHYYLVQEAVGTGGTQDLPTPDATGTLAMSGANGKVALVNTTTPLSGACPTGTVDLVGYGTANCFEGSATAALTSTTAAIRALGGCQDSDNAAVDFSVAAPNPRNSATPANVCLTSTAPSGAGLATPAAVLPAATTLLTVTVTPGDNPPSTALAVTTDLSAVGGSAAQVFYDDATHGDVTAADLVFSYSLTLDGGAAPGSFSLPVTIGDAQLRTGSAAIPFEVLGPLAVSAMDLQYATSELGPWLPTAGNLASGFRLNLDPLNTYYYFDVAAVTSNRPLAVGEYPFILDTAHLPAGFYAYWDSKGVNAGSTDWQAAMWQIINGQLPFFYLKVSATAPQYLLVDGLMRAIDVNQTQIMKIFGDFESGLYRFDSTVTDTLGSSSPLTLQLGLGIENQVTTLTLQQAADPLGPWLPVAGSTAAGYSMVLDAGREFYYLDVADIAITPALATGDHPFYLDVTQLPAAFYAYWQGRGVFEGATGTWEPLMWQIITGQSPMFYLRTSATAPLAMLIDGLQHDLNPALSPPLRLSGNYPVGMYQFTGDLLTETGPYTFISIQITFTENQLIQFTPPAALRTYFGVPASTALSALDPDGTLVTAAITGGGASGMSLTNIVPAAAVGGSLTATLALDATVPSGVYNVQVTFTNNDPFPQSSVGVVQVEVYPTVCPAPPAGYPLQANIGTVQGSGLTAAVTGNVSVTGYITNRVRNGGSGTQYGFYIQDSGDGDPATSDGLFVYTSTSNQQGTSLEVGSAVMISGVVSEFNKGTQIAPVANGVMSCGVFTTLSPLPLALPADSDPVTLLERYENMLVSVTQTLTVTQNYFVGRYGQITLSVDGRLFNPTNGNMPGTPAELTAANNQRMIVLDDNNNAQNPSPTPYLSLGDYPYTTDIFTPVRAGDEIAAVTGVLDQGAVNSTAGPYSPWYRIQPTVWPTITRGNPRTTAPLDPGGNVKVAGFNVYNYFTTLDMAPYRSTPPYDGANNTPRGADSALEFARQRAKTIQAIVSLGADVTGLIELENNGAVAIQDLVDGLNAEAGAGTYAFVVDTLPLPSWPVDPDGPDYIKAGIVYKPAAVTPLGASQWSNAAIFDRAPLAQTFRVNATGGVFSVVVNHFKSKGSCPTTGDVDQGQGCWNLRRVAQATELLSFINTSLVPVDPDVIVLGDLNAYGNEDPIQTLTAGGLVNEMLQVPPADRYTYVFDGSSGYLDQMLVTGSLHSAVTGVSIWHINADESALIDYNTEFKAPLPNYPPDPYDGTVANRSSDHDPVLLGLNVTKQPPTAGAGGPYTTPRGIPVQVSATATDPDSPSFTFAWDLNNDGVFETPGQTVMFTTVDIPGLYTIKVQVTDAYGNPRVAETTVRVWNMLYMPLMTKSMP